MALNYNNRPIKWTNEGTAPSTELKTSGFQAGYKPSAAVFNNQWHTTGECIEELQDKLSDAHDTITSDSTKLKGIGCGICNTAQGTSAKTVECDGFNLYDGARIVVTFANGNTCNYMTLDVNGTGAKYVYFPIGTSREYNNKIISKIIVGGVPYEFVYQDGDTPKWVYCGSIDIPINDTTPTHTEASSLVTLSSGESLSTAFGKIKKAISSLISHINSYGTASTPGHVKLSDSTSSTSSGFAATPKAVKIAYDKGVEAYNLAVNKIGVNDEVLYSYTLFQVAVDASDVMSACNSYGFAGPYEVVEAASEVSDKLSKTDVNIRKNPAGTTGDIIDTHLTVGKRTGTIGTNSFVTGGFNDIDLEQPNEASGTSSACIAGEGNIANNEDAVCVGGYGNTASGGCSVTLGGYSNTITGHTAVALGGCDNTVLDYQVKMGYNAKNGTAGHGSGTIGDAFIIGNGQIGTPSNAFRVTYTGGVYGLSAFKASGADYAEYFEWLDGNPNDEDRRGLFVCTDGEKIRLATSTDTDIIGVVSGNPSVCGDTHSEVWQGMYLKDVYGTCLLDKDGNFKINPEYDSKAEYVSREDRKEWAPIGLLGKLIVQDDGTCQVNGYCTTTENGIATASESGYKVLNRLDDSHVKILFK